MPIESLFVVVVMLLRFTTVMLVEILVIVVSTPIVIVVMLMLMLILLMLVLLRFALLLVLRLATLILLRLVRLLSSWGGYSSVGLLGRRLSGTLRIFTLSRILIQLDQVLKVQLLLIIFVLVRVVG